MSVETKKIDSKILPSNWKCVALKEVVRKLVDGSHNPPAKNGSGYPMLSARNIENNKIVYDDYRLISKTDYEREHKRTKIAPGDVLLTIVGTIGRSAIVPEGTEPLTLQRSVAVITPAGLLPKYLMYQLQSPSIQRYFEVQARGTAQKGVYLGTLGETPVCVAPIDEQKDIVAEIEKQFSRLDEAVSNLKRVKANLNRYKAAVLKAAVEGKLTDEWRKAHSGVEPASELLKRILAERKKKWEEAELTKMKSKGTKPKDDRWRQKYQEPTPTETTDLPELPYGWTWASIEQLAIAAQNAIKAGPFGSALKKSFYAPKGYKIYGQEQVINGNPFYGDYYIDETRYNTLKSCAVKPGDLLISLVGTIGRVLILPKGIEPGIINPRLVKLSLDPRLVKAEFIKACIESPFVKQLFSLISHGGTMDVLNLTILKSIPFPLPSLKEQNAILQEIDRVSSIEKRLEATISANLLRAERLRQSVLMKAFSGGLLPL